MPTIRSTIVPIRPDPLDSLGRGTLGGVFVLEILVSEAILQGDACMLQSLIICMHARDELPMRAGREKDGRALDFCFGTRGILQFLVVRQILRV